MPMTLRRCRPASFLNAIAIVATVMLVVACGEGKGTGDGAPSGAGAPAAASRPAPAPVVDPEPTAPVDPTPAVTDPTPSPPPAPADAVVAAPDSYPPLFAVVKTTRGTIRIKLYPNEAQMTVANFVNLCRHHYYDGLTWHYVQPAFKISTGDPAQATKSGSLGYFINHEFSKLSHDSEGCVSMSAAELHKVDSMFFITLAAMPGTDLKYSMFGRVVEGMDVVRAVQLNDRVDSITIEGDTTWLMLDYAPEIATWDRMLEGNLRGR